MPLDYEKLYKEALRYNVKNVKEDLRTGKLEQKIKNFCEKFDMAEKEVLGQIKSNKVVACLFAIDPNKQNFYETTAAGFIEEIPGVNGFNKHCNKVIAKGGVLTTNAELKASDTASATKEINFEWRFGGLQFYAYHKYTKEEGGAQDNQRRRLQTFIEGSNTTRLGKTHFIAIADGEYYQLTSKHQVRRIDELKQSAQSERVHVCTINELEEILKQIVSAK